MKAKRKGLPNRHLGAALGIGIAMGVAIGTATGDIFMMIGIAASMTTVFYHVFKQQDEKSKNGE